MMSDESATSKEFQDNFISDFSQRNSDIVFRPSGIEEASFVYNGIVLALTQLDIPGPLDLNGITSDMKFLGAGALFEVYGLVATVHTSFPHFDGPESGSRIFDDGANVTSSQRLVAVKKVKIVETQDVYGSCISLKTRSDGQADLDHLNLLFTEVRTITSLKHPNIVKLLAWGFEATQDPEDSNSRRSFFLVLEHALGSADLVLKATDFPWVMKAHLSAGVIAGVKTLHRHQIIHGDVKPDNVLIFGSSADGYDLVAKVADFNFAWTGLSMRIPRGTYGWSAPEIESYDKTTPDLRERLQAADVWSLALTIWSMLFTGGSRIPYSAPSQYAPRLQNLVHNSNLPGFKRERLSQVLTKMLDPDPSNRPIEFDSLRMALSTPKEPNVGGRLLRSVNESLGVVLDNTTNSRIQTKFELKSKPNSEYLHDSFTRIPEREPRSSWLHSRRTFYHAMDHGSPHHSFQTMPLAQLFSSAIASLHFQRLKVEKLKSIRQDSKKLMVEVAMRGYFPAQAWIVAIWNERKQELPSQIQPYLDRWNFNAIASGFLFSPWCLQSTKPPMYEQAKSLFRYMGGYNLHYCGQDMAHWDASHPGCGEYVSGLIGLLERDLLGHPLHLAAALNNPRLEHMLLMDMWAQQVHTKDRNGDTPLMKCCMAGHIEALRWLVEARSNAMTVNEIFGYNASHWVFTFADDVVDEAVSLLVQAGADFTVRNRKSISAFHAPFGWPCGNALHWAVFANNPHAVRSLVRHSTEILDQTDWSGETPLHMALKMLNAPIVEILLTAGFNLHGRGLENTNDYLHGDQNSVTTSSSGMVLDPLITPVHDFLCSPLDPNAILFDDTSFYAGYWLHPKVRFDLFRAGKYVEGVADVLKVILAHAPDCLFWKDSEDQYPLHHLLENSNSMLNPEVLGMLTHYGPGLHENDESQLSPLSLHFLHNNLALEDDALHTMLLNEFKKLPADVCASFLNRRYTRLHEELPAFPIYPVTDNYRPIHFASELGLPNCMQLFLDFGADPIVRTEDANLTALDVAINALTYLPASPSNSPSSLRSMSSLPSIKLEKFGLSLDDEGINERSPQTLDLSDAGEQRPQRALASTEGVSSSDSLQLPTEDRDVVERNEMTGEPQRFLYINLHSSLPDGHEGRLVCIAILRRLMKQMRKVD